MRQFRISRLCAALALGGCATTPNGVDLTVGWLAAPSETTAGSSIEVTSALKNSGGIATDRPASMDIDIYFDLNAAPMTPLTAWRQPDGETLAAGERVDDIANVRAPLLKPGAYSICATADPDDEIRETDESNNRACVPFTIVPGAPKQADLVIEKVTSLGQDQASTKVKIKIRNAGSVATGAFRIMAFRRSPRFPILLIECPLTEGQLSSGSPASCDDLTQRGVLAAGESVELTGWLAYVVANGASLISQPVGPGNPNPLVTRDIDFMVDGCFPPADGSPVWCAVEEIDEINNFEGASLKVR